MARKTTSLRDYQIAFAERLRDLSREGVQRASKLAFVAGDAGWLVNLFDVAEVLPVPLLARVPLCQPYFLGACNVRGSLYSVVDFAGFTSGQPPLPPVPQNRLLLLPAAKIQSAALLVSRMAGLRQADAFQPMDADPGAPAWVAARWSDREGRLWQELDIAALAISDRFIDVGR